MSQKHLVYVDGQEGTTGLRIHEMLAARSDIEVLKIEAEKRKNVAERARLINASDVTFLCLPDAASREAASLVTNPKTCLIDASTAFRTDPNWVFGLPELAPGQRDAIRASRRIANPGCHATAFILLVRPLVDAGLISPDALLSATSITGYSGGGKSMIEAYEAGGNPDLMAPRPYGLGLAHKHLPEMKAHGRLLNAPIFMPIVGPFLKGLTVSILLPVSMLKTGPVSGAAEAVQDCLANRYQGEAFVQVMPLRDPETLAGGFFNSQRCNETNRAELFIFGNDEQVLLMACIDNLGKGASGAAVQNMNLVLGCEEGAGLVN